MKCCAIVCFILFAFVVIHAAEFGYNGMGYGKEDRPEIEFDKLPEKENGKRYGHRGNYYKNGNGPYGYGYDHNGKDNGHGDNGDWYKYNGNGNNGNGYGNNGYRHRNNGYGNNGNGNNGNRYGYYGK